MHSLVVKPLFGDSNIKERCSEWIRNFNYFSETPEHFGDDATVHFPVKWLYYIEI